MMPRDSRENDGDDAWGADDWRALRQQQRKTARTYQARDITALRGDAARGVFDLTEFSAEHVRMRRGAHVVDYYPTRGTVVVQGRRLERRGIGAAYAALGIPLPARSGGTRGKRRKR